MQELNRRNTETVEFAMQDMYKKIYEQQARIDGLNAVMSGMIEKLSQMEQMLFILKAKASGTGATA